MMYGKEIWKIFILAVLSLGHSLQEITLPRAAVHHQAALALLRTKSQKSGMGREIALFRVHDTVTNVQKKHSFNNTHTNITCKSNDPVKFAIWKCTQSPTRLNLSGSGHALN